MYTWKINMGLLKEGDKSGNSNAVWTGALQCSVKGAGILYKHINSSGITSSSLLSSIKKYWQDQSIHDTYNKHRSKRV